MKNETALQKSNGRKGGSTAGNLGKIVMFNSKPLDYMTANAMGLGTLFKGLYSGNAKTQK